MTRRVLPLVALATLFLAAWRAAPQTPESWRPQALAAFDEAWQAVHDTFYDPSFGGIDWPAVRDELRPKVETARSADAARAVIETMLTRLKRSHFVLLSNAAAVDAGPIGEATVPVEMRVTDEGVMLTRVEPAARAAGLSPGQVVRAIDGMPAVEWKVSGDDPVARARRLDFWRAASRRLHGDLGSMATLAVRAPDGVERTVSVARAAESGEIVRFGNLPPLAVRIDTRDLRTPHGRRVGLIAFNLWMTAIDAPVEAAVDRYRTADGLIIDLRGNPGGLAAMMSGISGQVLADGSLLLGRMQTRQAQLEFRPNPRISTRDGRRVRPYAGPLAILVDEMTASTSECFAGALQSLGRARIFGLPTLGQALPAITKQLSNGDVLMYAVGNFVTSSGRALEGEGVIPDERVPRSAASLAGGHDDVVEAALRWFDAVR